MDDLGLTQDIAQSFVNGTMAGFTDYVKRRNQDAEDMIISRADAWTKGNFIDNAVAKEIKQIGIDYQRKMAGYSWEYLQFDYYDKQAEASNSVILKNYKTLTNSMGSRENRLPEYLAKDSIGNIDVLNKHETKIHSTDLAVQLELLPSVPSPVSNSKKVTNTKYNRFYVVGYSLERNGNIEFLKLLMPNPQTNALVEVEDWTKYIVDAPIKPNPDDLVVLQNEKEVPEGQYDDTSKIKYEIADNSKEKKN